jgi:hypothetical protein
VSLIAVELPISDWRAGTRPLHVATQPPLNFLLNIEQPTDLLAGHPHATVSYVMIMLLKQVSLSLGTVQGSLGIVSESVNMSGAVAAN